MAVRAGVDYRDVMPSPAKLYLPPSNNNSRCTIGDTLEIVLPGRDPGFMMPAPEGSSTCDPGFIQPKPLDRFTEIFTELF